MQNCLKFAISIFVYIFLLPRSASEQLSSPINCSVASISFLEASRYRIFVLCLVIHPALPVYWIPQPQKHSCGPTTKICQVQNRFNSYPPAASIIFEVGSGVIHQKAVHKWWERSWLGSDTWKLCHIAKLSALMSFFSLLSTPITLLVWL